MCPVLHKLQIGFGVIEVTAPCKVQGPSFVQRTIVIVWVPTEPYMLFNYHRSPGGRAT